MDGPGGVLIGVGHDLQSVNEVEAAKALQVPGLFFTEAEVARFEQSPSPGESLAAGFSAKEAFFKALPPVDGWFWTDAEVTRDARHAPAFRFHGVLAEQMAARRLSAALSLSHSGGFVSSVVIVTAAPAAF